MQVLISNPDSQTQIFIIIFVLSLILSAKKRLNLGFSPEVTQELKGFAILAVIFSHIGYFLVTDHQFLFPLSVLAGVGVNLFLFLSGFGLIKSFKKSDHSIVSFYQKRLPKLFLPFLIILLTFLSLDRLFLNIVYPADLTFKNLFGFFPSADIYHNIDSPLWYFSLIFFYYLIAPLFFQIKNSYLASFGLLIFSFIFFNLPLPINSDVQDLYKVHFIAFPLGVAFSQFDQVFFLWLKKLQLIFFPLSAILLIYTSINSGVGSNKFSEQAISLITMFSILVIFVLNRYQIRLFNLFGKYSYEIYLIHWPILYRYDHLYKILPAGLATVFYLIEFLALASILQKIINILSAKLRLK